MESASYFPRHLRVINEGEEAQRIDELGLIAMQGPKVILGEPGMGKSELIREIGRLLEIKLISATRLMHHPRPESFVTEGKPLLIDGLDEAIAYRDGDAVDLIFAKLEEAGNPDFMLSCRAREWQSRNESKIRQIYDIKPTVLILEALSREEAQSFLSHHYQKIDAPHVLGHLDANGIADLYSNPLTLGLIGRVAESNAELPQTRGALFDSVCSLIWPEHDPDRSDLGLGLLSNEQALSAAGAIAAGMLLAGADAVSQAVPLQTTEGDIRLADLKSLPGAEAVGEILSSKLFQSIGVGRATLIHRVIAEFLGARWLAQVAKTGRAQRRLLNQMSGSGNVPSSLRGLHAWIAYHSASMANDVIAADPFGVLRYGDASRLTAEQAERMLDALNDLAKDDPYFRAQDWARYATAGLMNPALKDKIQKLIASGESNAHLRSLLIQGLHGAQLASELADTLESIVFSASHFYGERSDALAALMPYRDRAWCQSAIMMLLDLCTEDSARLARELVEEIDCDVNDEVLVTTLLTCMGLTRSAVPKRRPTRAISLFHYRRFGRSLPIARVQSVLDLIAEFSSIVENSDHRGLSSLAQFISVLIVRSIDERVVDPDSPSLLWTWLGAVKHLHGVLGDDAKNLRECLESNVPLRHAIQLHGLYVARPKSSILATSYELDSRLVGLNADDILWLLGRMESLDNQCISFRDDWQGLMVLGYRQMGMSTELRAIGSLFQRCDQELESFIYQLQNPEKLSWEIENERRVELEEERLLQLYEQDRRWFTEEKASLRAGDLRLITAPAKIFLGFEYFSHDSGKDLDALREWMGEELANDALAGFEAVLHRFDLPTPMDVANGFADNKTYNFSYAIMAGLRERQRRSISMEDLPLDTRKVGLLLCLSDGVMSSGDEVSALREKLSLSLIVDDSSRDAFAKLWLEPSVRSGVEHISGLHGFLNGEYWHGTNIRLAREWLTTYEGMSDSLESDLIDCLVRTGELTSLASIAEQRELNPFRDENQLLNWLAVDVLTRFEVVKPRVSGVGVDHPEFIWCLKDRLESNKRILRVSVSIEQAKWMIEQFRVSWPYAILEGTAKGSQNPFDATDFLRVLINRIANDTSAEASEAFNALMTAADDTYSNLISHMAAQQRQARSEKEFVPILPNSLRELLTEGPPSNSEDLKSLVVEELHFAQKILIGDELDQVRDFWHDDGVPYDENRCRDRLAALIGPVLERYNIRQLTEADMPNTKRVDLAFACGAMQLPMEVKGQWHPEVWNAATHQLDLQYLIDWRSDDRGIYCVLWFGDLATASGRRLKAPPNGVETPGSASEMKALLIDRIPEHRRSHIDVVVLDLTAGKPKPQPKPA